MELNWKQQTKLRETFFISFPEKQIFFQASQKKERAFFFSMQNATIGFGNVWKND